MSDEHDYWDEPCSCGHRRGVHYLDKGQCEYCECKSLDVR